MSISEFRYNKKRKHYAYIFKIIGAYRKNIVLSSKLFRKCHRRIKRNIVLFKHPNPNSNQTIYVIPYIYIDHVDSFDCKILKWSFHSNDKRKIKRIKRKKI